MNTAFQVVTSPAFERSARRVTRRSPELAALLAELIGILETDPYNRTRRYDITKLTGVKPGNGQWRIRQGDYRLRYDISGREVVLYHSVTANPGEKHTEMM